MTNFFLGRIKMWTYYYVTIKTRYCIVYCRSTSMFGLALIAIGSGAIKPCLAAFGGDQVIIFVLVLNLHM